MIGRTSLEVPLSRMSLGCSLCSLLPSFGLHLALHVLFCRTVCE